MTVEIVQQKVAHVCWFYRLGIHPCSPHSSKQDATLTQSGALTMLEEVVARVDDIAVAPELLAERRDFDRRESACSVTLD